MTNLPVRESKTLREFVDVRGTRYTNLARLLGVTPGHVSRLLDGKRRITEAQAERLAAFYGEPIETFRNCTFVGGDE